MVVFQCESCGDSIKKPKVAAHYGQCAAAAFTCIDCSRTFDRRGVAGHTSCVTEHEKYAQGATKPGGFAAAGFYGEGPAGGPGGPGSGGANGGGGGAAAAAADGAEYLATRPPWTCGEWPVGC
jgi:cell growth-regulating nucleolar protein